MSCLAHPTCAPRLRATSLTGCLLAILALAPMRVAAEEVAPQGTPYRLWLGPDLAVTGVGLVLWVTPTIIMHDQVHGPPCNPDPCNVADINVAERWVVNVHNENARTASDALFGAVPVLFLALELPDTGFHNAPAFFTDFAIVSEALTWSGAIDEIFRRAVHRPRPYTYVANLYPDRRVEGEANFSYYSGHTSAVFAFSSVLAYTFQKRHPHSPWRWVVWTGLYAFSSLEGVLRVWSGDHFPSDVLTGAVVGTGIGLLASMVHVKRAQSPVLSSLTLAPSRDGDVTTFWLAGRF